MLLGFIVVKIRCDYGVWGRLGCGSMNEKFVGHAGGRRTNVNLCVGTNGT